MFNRSVNLVCLAAEIKESMELGLRAILKLDEVENILGKVEIKRRSISKSHFWKDLKDQF